MEYERRHGWLLAARAGHNRINELYRQGLISTPSWEQLSPELEGQVATEAEARQELLRQEPRLQQEEQEDARLEGLRAQRAMLAELQSSGVISELVYEELATEVDAALQASHQDESESEE